MTEVEDSLNKCMKIKDFKIEYTSRILQIYEEVTGGNNGQIMDSYDLYMALLDEVEDNPKSRSHSLESAIGSSWAARSKLYIDFGIENGEKVIERIRFDSNIDKGSLSSQEAYDAEERFSAEIDAYFASVANGTNNTPEDMEAREDAKDWKEMFAELKESYLENPTKGTKWQQERNKIKYRREIK